ncbi:class I SAM-dependent methyltransferase [Methylacidiphilum caldifontis]|uniref:class I SAM-dependent methyltransferase n=1 Tax=Methylacidiphilum caldifontis TaxID=2795386 RepID=UPI001A908DB1|nr:class I SAM-dependent methyltransferase [Methylacidiphilum caldifontis]QSR89620.1 class I SAM-dependent methyltransferase [Methylacidiphilum caldifontis]
MERKLEEMEYLDIFPPDSVEAIKGRRGLKKINFIMGNFFWFKRKVKNSLSFLDKPAVFLEIGAGDGSLGQFLYRDSLLRQKMNLTGLDRIPRPQGWPKDWNWIRMDLFEFIKCKDFVDSSSFQGILANMVLHHFSSSQLEGLGEWINKIKPSFLFFCEPLRSGLTLVELSLLRLVGLNPITFHDGLLSIKSGFYGDELPVFLGLHRVDWPYQIKMTWLGAYRFEAIVK